MATKSRLYFNFDKFLAQNSEMLFIQERTFLFRRNSFSIFNAVRISVKRTDMPPVLIVFLTVWGNV